MQIMSEIMESRVKQGLRKEILITLHNAEKEMSRNIEFDKVILNDDFDIACAEIKKVIINFIHS